MRQPDRLHFPYSPPPQGSSPYSLHKGVFHEGPLVSRAEPCTQLPQEQNKLEQQATNKATPMYNGQSNPCASEGTHVSHTARGPLWEPQCTHYSMPPRNVQEDESLIQTLRSSADLDPFLEALNTERGWPSQLHCPNCEPILIHPT